MEATYDEDTVRFEHPGFQTMSWALGFWRGLGGKSPVCAALLPTAKANGKDEPRKADDDNDGWHVLIFVTSWAEKDEV